MESGTKTREELLLEDETPFELASIAIFKVAYFIYLKKIFYVIFLQDAERLAVGRLRDTSGYRGRGLQQTGFVDFLQFTF